MESRETPGTREAVSKMAESLKKEGMPADRAKDIARKAAIRADRRAENKR